MGATRWQTLYTVVIPFSISGITSGVVLGIGRAIGETMAVLMVTGNAAVIPTTILEPLRTIPATIAAELGEAPDVYKRQVVYSRKVDNFILARPAGMEISWRTAGIRRPIKVESAPCLSK